MALSLNKRRSVNNLQVLQKIQNNSLVYFKNCQKNTLEDHLFFAPKQDRLVRSSGSKYKKTLISINGQTSEWNLNNIPQKDTLIRISQIKNNFYQVLMEESTHLTFNNITFASDQNKENKINLQNQNLQFFTPEQTLQPCPRTQKIQKLINQKILQNYNIVDKTMKKLNLMEKQVNLNQSSPGMRKIKMIDKLINMMETNKNMRIREMFDERQHLSENQDQQKKLYQKKLEKVKEVENKFKSRKIDEFTAIHELNGIRG